MTDAPKPVKAWAVIRNDNYWDADRVFRQMFEAQQFSAKHDLSDSEYAPYRVIPVLITPIGEDHD